MLEKISQNTPKSNFLQSCKVIFCITFRQMMRSKKTIFMPLIAFSPVLLSAYYRMSGHEMPMSPEQFLFQITVFFLMFISILVALFYGTALVADEIDNKTIIYLFTRPIRKYTIIIGKFAAYILQVLLISIPPMLLTFLIIATDSRMSSDFAYSLSLFSKRLCVIILSLSVYGAIFTFLGALWKRSVIVGLLFAFGWEKMVIVVPGIIKKFSVIHYLLSVFPKDTTMRRFMKMPIFTGSNPIVSIVILIAFIGIFLGLSIHTLYHKEYRFN